VGPTEHADVYVVNTCTVTHVADSKARQALRAASDKNPQALVVATGCYAQRAPEELTQVRGVGLVAGNREKHRLVEMVLAARGDQPVACAVGEEPSILVDHGTLRTRAMVKIQEGCNQVCAYCIVPKVRGRERSIPTEVLLGQVRARVEEGYREVVLTGTQLGSYGFDLDGEDLEHLISLLLRDSGIERLRVSSLQPQEITGELLELWDDPRLCPHFHMPLQSGSDRILSRMRRRYTSAQYARAVDAIRARVRGVSITGDVIVGFPGEEQEHFGESLSLAHELEFASMHVFPYSVRPGTSAAHMGLPVEEVEKRARMDQMLDLAQRQAAAFRQSSLGSIRPVLWERSQVWDGKNVILGLTDNYLKVFTTGATSLVNHLTLARLVSEKGERVLAEVV